MHLKRQLVCPPCVSAFDALNDSTWQRHLAEKIVVLSCIVYKRSKKYYEKLTIYKCGEK